jgi:hypothetical protein
MKIKNQKPIELFRRDRFNLTFSDINIPSECIKGMSSLICNNDTEKWENVCIYLQDEIGLNLSKIIKNQRATPFSFLLEKLGLTGEVLEEFTVIGHIQEYNLGGFGYIEDLMGLDYSLPNEIELEISIADVTIVNKQNND